MDDNPRSAGPGNLDVPSARLDRRPRRILLPALRRWVVPVAAPAGIALAIAAGVDFVNRAKPAPSEADKKTPGPSGSSLSGPAGPLLSKDRPLPRYLVGVRRSGTAVVIRDVRTLATIAEVAAPANRRFQQVAAAGSGSYVIAGSAGGGIAFYRLPVAGDGRPGALRPLPRIWIPGTSRSWSDMAVNERGDMIAYVSYHRAPKRIAIDIVSAAGGPRRTWTTSHAGRIGGLSWAGRTLAFVWAPMRGTTVVRRQVRTLDTGLPAGDLKISRPVLTLPAGADTAVMSRDGAEVVTGVTRSGSSGSGSSSSAGVELAAYSAADGRRADVLWRLPGAAPRVVQLVPNSAGGDLIAESADGRLLVGPGHGATGFVDADLVDVAW
jgi:hypothetical protein